MFASAAVSCVLKPHRKETCAFSMIELLSLDNFASIAAGYPRPGFPMGLDRRAFIAGSVGAFLPGTDVTATAANVQTRRPIRAVLFDAFPLFDPRPVLAIAERVDPEKGAMLAQAWRTRQFEYQWLRALGDRYVDFWQATEDSLAFAARQVGLTLTTGQQKQLMAPYADLAVWPDVAETLPMIERLGVRLGILSNLTGSMLESGLAKTKLRSLFSHVLSTDRVRSYKPARPAYELGVNTLGLERSEILFVAFAGWDVAGAVWFGYPTYWLNRLGSVAEQLDAAPLGTGTNLQSLFAFLVTQNA
jgi:2-haloacid dehalogenase